MVVAVTAVIVFTAGTLKQHHVLQVGEVATNDKHTPSSQS